LFHVYDPPGAVRDFDLRAVWAFSSYYASSFAGHRCGSSLWLNRLWAVRQRESKDFADRALFFAFKTWLEPTAEEKDFDKFFYQRYTYGVSVVSNGGKQIGEVGEILASTNEKTPEK
jgi:hypothetical protein